MHSMLMHAEKSSAEAWWEVDPVSVTISRHLVHHLVTGKATASFPTLALAEEKLFEDIGLLLACDIMIALQLEMEPCKEGIKGGL